MQMLPTCVQKTKLQTRSLDVNQPNQLASQDLNQDGQHDTSSSIYQAWQSNAIKLCRVELRTNFNFDRSTKNTFLGMLTFINCLVVSQQVAPCKISGGLSGQMSWSKTQGEVHEETLTWSVDSLVKVNKKQTAWAALVVHEENLDVDFQVRTILQMLHKTKIQQEVKDLRHIWDIS